MIIKYTKLFYMIWYLQVSSNVGILKTKIDILDIHKM